MSDTRQETCNRPCGGGELAPTRRALGILLTWVLLVVSQPGLLRPDGFGHLAFVALAPWALVTIRPGRRRKLVEWLVASVGLIGTFWWMRHLLPYLLPAMGLVPALWIVIGGAALRRLARRFPLAVAVPAAWTLAEMARWFLPPPLSFGWWRLGFYAHDSIWFSASARVWGTWGLTWVFAAFSGFVADWIRCKRPTAVSAVCGLGPIVLAVFLGALVGPPETKPGPNLLIVTPNAAWGLKATSTDLFGDLWVDPMTLTLEGIEAAEAPIDLVCWGESLSVGTVLLPGALEAFDAGARAPGWSSASWGPDCDAARERRHLVLADRQATELMAAVPMGRPSPFLGTPQEGVTARVLADRDVPFAPAVARGERLLPEGTSLFSGVLALTAHEGELRRVNGAALWAPDGTRSPVASKLQLVPAAEDASVAARIPFALSIMESVGGFVPDFVSLGEVTVLPLTTRDGATYDLAALVCYDNVFDAPFRLPLEAGDVDAFLIPSNESWYHDSVELDHMIAFSRLAAIQSGRALARVTLSGISGVIGPDGRIVDLLEVDGRTKQVRGVLEVRLPVPADPASRTPWARSAGWQPWAWLGAIAVLLVLAGSPVTRPRTEVTTADTPTGPGPGAP